MAGAAKSPTLESADGNGTSPSAIPTPDGRDTSVSFAELVHAHSERQEELGAGTADGPWEAEYRRRLRAFKDDHGALLDSYWCRFESSGVAITDGTLNLRSVYGSVDDPELAAVEILPSTGGAPPPPPPPPPAPTVVSQTPANAATNVGVSTAVTATFSRDMDPASITATTFTLSPTAGTAVAATVAYDAATLTATLSPSAPLTNSTGYTARLTTGVRAADGTALASAVTWSFTTVAAGGGGAGTSIVRINAGGNAFTAGGALAFSADTGFTGGATYSTGSAIAGTTDDALYQNERWASSATRSR